MSDGMILMSQGAIDALEEQAWAEGKVAGREEAEEEQASIRREMKRLEEILEVEGDQSLLDAAEHLGGEKRAYEEAWKKEMHRNNALQKEIDAVKQYAIEVRDAYEPMQRRAHDYANEIVRLKNKLSELGVEEP